MAKANKQRRFGARENLDADRLKDSVREMLLLMEALERKLFIKTLEYEMSRSGLRIRDYLIKNGVDASRIKVNPYGESRPVTAISISRLKTSFHSCRETGLRFGYLSYTCGPADTQ